MLMCPSQGNHRFLSVSFRDFFHCIDHVLDVDVKERTRFPGMVLIFFSLRNCQGFPPGKSTWLSCPFLSKLMMMMSSGNWCLSILDAVVITRESVLFCQDYFLGKILQKYPFLLFFLNDLFFGPVFSSHLIS